MIVIEVYGTDLLSDDEGTAIGLQWLDEDEKDVVLAVRRAGDRKELARLAVSYEDFERACLMLKLKKEEQ